MSIDLHTPLADTDRPWNHRLLRLQGWRGADVTEALASGVVRHIAPAFCAVGGAAVALSESPMLALLLSVTAIAGVFASNHPVEMLANQLAVRRGAAVLPPNRAAKRSGCAIGSVMLVASAVAIVIGSTTVGATLGWALAGIAGFVAASGICVPSVIFTVLWGEERAQAPSLLAAYRTGPAPRVTSGAGTPA